MHLSTVYRFCDPDSSTKGASAKYNPYYCFSYLKLYNDIMADAPTLPTYKSGLLWGTANRVFRIKVAEALAKFDLAMTEWALLGKLYESRPKGVHLADIASALSVEPPLITTMVSQLENKGFVVRKEDVRDRRAKFIHLTEKGSELVPRVEEAMQKTFDDILNNVSEAERISFLSVLQSIVKNAG